MSRLGRMSLLLAAAAGLLASASSSSGMAGHTIDLLNRSHEPPPRGRGFGRGRLKADKTAWNQNLRRAQSNSKRGGSRPVMRGR